MKELIKNLKLKTYKLLKWSERYTKTDMIYLTKGGTWLSFAHLASMTSTFLLAVAFANLLPKSSYGTYKYILSIAAIIGAFTYSGIAQAITRAVAKGQHGALIEGAKVHAKWNLIAILITLGTSTYYFLNDNFLLAFGVLIAGSFAPFISTFALYGQYLVGTKDFKRKTIYGFFQSTVTPLFLIISAFFTDNPLILILIFYTSSIITVGLLFFISTKKIKGNESDEGKKFDIKRYGAHLSVMNLVGAFSFQIDKILLFHFLGATQLAIYSISLAAPQQLRQVSKTLTGLTFPKVATRPIETLQKTLPRKAFLVLLGSILIAGLYIIFAPLIFKIFFNPYLESVHFSQLYALVILVLPITLFKDSLIAHSKTKELYIIQTIIPLAKVILLLILLPKFGILGAVMSLIIMEVINFSLTLFLFQRSKSIYKFD